MAFIKLDNIVVNTNYIAAVRLQSHTPCGEESVFLLVAFPTMNFPKQESSATGASYYEWLEFTGAAARALKDYFSSFNNVTDLMPSNYCCDINGYELRAWNEISFTSSSATELPLTEQSSQVKVAKH